MAKEEQSQRHLYIMRHGERVDYVFSNWIKDYFSGASKNANMPRSLPHREQEKEAYAIDPPLTQIGLHQATLMGESLKRSGVKIQQIYCSPAFRCVQTADALLRGMGERKELPINIETGLFEWMFWNTTVTPEWLTCDELIAAGYNINCNYQPIVDRSEILDTTNFEQYQKRSTFITNTALAANTDGNILLVGHASTLEVCSRQLVGEPPTMSTLICTTPHFSYCSLIALNKSSGKWEFIEPPCFPPTHSKNRDFPWKILQ